MVFMKKESKLRAKDIAIGGLLEGKIHVIRLLMLHVHLTLVDTGVDFKIIVCSQRGS